jgi:ABC-type transport system involved in cytochrome c biogenesis permease subunit
LRAANLALSPGSRWSPRLLAAALTLHAAWLAVRGLAAGRLPLGNLYESLLVLSLVLGLKSAAFRARGELGAGLKAALAIPGCAVLAAALLFPAELRRIAGTEPALRSPWMALHVPAVMAGYASIAFAACAAAVERRRAGAERRRTGGVDRSKTDPVAREARLGVFLLGLGIVAGGVWAQECWGAFWTWDPKETWALITWLLVLAAAHPVGRTARDVLLILCVGAMLFTYFGVSFLLPGLHAYLG